MLDFLSQLKVAAEHAKKAMTMLNFHASHDVVKTIMLTNHSLSFSLHNLSYFISFYTKELIQYTTCLHPRCKPGSPYSAKLLF